MKTRAKTSNTSTTDSFEFTVENLEKAQMYLGRYPKDRRQSAVMPLLWLAQKQSGGWLPTAALEYVAHYLNMPYIRVYEVASFYTMYNLNPVGEHLIQVCRTTPCWLRGAADITKACKEHLNIDLGETTKDGKFTLMEVECLGACANSPMVQINDDYVEDLNPETMVEVLKRLAKGEKVGACSMMGREGSAPSAVSEKQLSIPKKSSRKERK